MRIVSVAANFATLEPKFGTIFITLERRWPHSFEVDLGRRCMCRNARHELKARVMSLLAMEPLEIEGPLLFRPKRFVDARGYFTETYSVRTYAKAGVGATFVQDNQSLSIDRGTIRGLHFQAPPEPQAKLIRVIQGSIYDVAVDLRRGSVTFGRWCAVTLSAEGGEQFFVPRGFAHGFCTLEPETIVAYKVDGYYAPACDSGLRWDDPDLGIPWPVDPAAAIVSDKDAKLGFLQGFDSPFSI